jgi:hypothetical protein
MVAPANDMGPGYGMRAPDRQRNPVFLLLLCLACAGTAPTAVRSAEGDTPQAGATQSQASVTRVVIVEGAKPTEQDVAGSYNKNTLGVGGGMAKGVGAGYPSVDVGPISVGTSAPILMLPGAIVGGLYGKAQEALQDFRDALADDLANAADTPLTNSRLALHVYQNLRNLPGIETRLLAATATIPDDTDTVIYVSLRDVAIDVEGSDAKLKTTAEVDLQYRHGGAAPEQRWFYYQDQDTLSNWTDNDNALWRDYANFANHYLGREIASNVFSGVKLKYQLQPKNTASMASRRNDEWHGTSKSVSPSVAWELTLGDQDAQHAWANGLGETDIDFDLEIYDGHRLVYARERIPDPVHQLQQDLEPCQTYRWSVRPVYRVGNQAKFGEWMRMHVDADNSGDTHIIGRRASTAPAYTQDFAVLAIDCKAK